MDLTPGEQRRALRSGEIDIGLTNESGELLAGEFYTGTLAEVGSYIALPERHRLATRDRVRLSDLKGEFFVSGDSQQLPGRDRRVEAYCKKVREVSPEISRPGANPCPRLRVNRQRKCCSYVAAPRQPSFSARRRLSTPGRPRGYLEDCGHVAVRQSRWCSKGIVGRPVFCER